MIPENKQIFIVDDDISVCRALRILLATHGFTVSTYTCAEEFFRAVPNSAAGCLLLDIHMPGLDGWEAIKRLIKSKATRPVIIITADKNGGLERQALEVSTLQ